MYTVGLLLPSGIEAVTRTLRPSSLWPPELSNGSEKGWARAKEAAWEAAWEVEVLLEKLGELDPECGC